MYADKSCIFKMEPGEITDFLRLIGVGRRPIKDSFFNETYETCKVFQRKGVTVDDEEELCHEVMKEFVCNACTETFQNLLDYELHYNNWHRFVCNECKKICASTRLLDIHIQETHDSFFTILAERQPMYQCFVSECDMKFQNPIERREHCIKLHEFPKSYRFDDSTRFKSKQKSQEVKMIVDSIDPPLLHTQKHRKSKPTLEKNQKCKMFNESKASFTQNNSTEKSTTETPKSSSLRFVPRQVVTKMQLHAKEMAQNQEMEINVPENVSMMEIIDSLPTEY